MFEKEFEKFNANITLTSKKKEELRKSRKSLREEIKRWFDNNDKKSPKFHGQGSYSMNTILNVIKGDEYDIDDGVYLQDDYGGNQENWPKPSEVHSWIVDAVKGHTSVPSVNKETCVRVEFASRDYHVDIPSYIMSNDIAYLSHLQEGWIESDPKAITDWFMAKLKVHGEQLRSVVKYIKAWKDYQNSINNVVHLKGLTIAILVGEEFYSNDEDFDSLSGTLKKIELSLKNKFSCKKPVPPFDELLEEKYEEKTLTDIHTFLNKLQQISETDNVDKINRLFNELFGDRFPIVNEIDEENKYHRTEHPARLGDDHSSAN